MRTLRIVLLVSAALTTAAVAATTFTPLGARPGLWQVTVQMTGSIPFPPEALARLPAAQRAKIVADMQKPIVTKQCLTQAQLQKGFDPAQANGQHCTRTMIASSATGFTMHMECKHERGSLVTGNFQLALVDATHFRGSSAMTMTIQGKTSNLGSNVAGQWVSADCGNVKPNMPE